MLDVRSSAAQQIAVALEGREALDAVHVVAHGAPGRVVFASDEWTINTLDGAADDLAAIGKSLGDKGELRIWSCETGAGKLGEAFLEGLAGTVGADVRASGSRVGAAALGGAWKLDMAKTCSAKSRPAAFRRLPPRAPRLTPVCWPTTCLSMGR